MNKLVLPQVHASRSPQFILFEQEFENLNAFYWVHRAATALMLKHAPNHDRINQFIPAPEAQHLDISSNELIGLSNKVQLTARYSMLVQVVTFYEVYIGDFLFDLMKARWPATTQVSIKIRPSDLPDTNLETYIQTATINAQIKSVVDESYQKREARIRKLLTENKYDEPLQSPQRSKLVTAACEIRNCIVHAGGKVDQRAVETLTDLIPTLQLGDQLMLEEPLMWQLLGAIRDSARALDYVVRKPVAEKFERRAAKNKRYYAARKLRNLELAKKHKKL
ncbi:hypothetical protein [Noviherbaspirillum pedocola]|uniref:Uncharacterized protein n=1 Tax=Noviherbaspirillum pedocola TaxID=2801341 RepID=A0A934SV40_9BURK|nr:hypothetical protein [Noviherbaspirillum pedocola]MBK4737356.1 hypothetical protein [Noviherbaspirillum pedocola]